MAEIKVKVPIKFSDKAQKDLYETCMAYKELAEIRDAENDKLRKLVKDMFNCISHANGQDWFYFEREETGCGLSCTVNGEECGLMVLADRMQELGIEVRE